MTKSTIAAIALSLCVAACEDRSATPTTSTPAPTTPATPTTMPMTAATTTASASASATSIANAKCPVSGDAVDPKGKTVAYQGKTIGFCCEDCIEPFQKDPAKYAANIK